jgi:serine/threonine protein phosphatase PrpC
MTESENFDTTQPHESPDEDQAAAMENKAESTDSPVVEKAKETAPIVPEPMTPALIGGAHVEETRPLTTHLRAEMRSEMGMRNRNEDSGLIFSANSGGHFPVMPFGLYIVADGMGGHANGHVASRIASRIAGRHILQKLYFPLLTPSEVPAQLPPVQEVLIDAVQKANTGVFESDPENDSGTTLTIALVLGRRLHVAHVGDSRLYLLKNDYLEAVTHDHSLVQRLQEVGHLSAEEATVYRYRNVLLRAVGQEKRVEIDTYMRLLPQRGQLLLCSDGLCGFVSDRRIKEILVQEGSISEKVANLYDAAMAMGSNDNITSILINFELK